MWSAWRCARRAWCELTGGHRFGAPWGVVIGSRHVGKVVSECSRCGRIVEIDLNN